MRSGCKGHRAVLSPAAAVVAVRGCVGLAGWQVGTALSGWPTFEQGRQDLTSRWSALTIMELAALILILAAGKMALLCFSLDLQKDDDFQFEKC